MSRAGFADLLGSEYELIQAKSLIWRTLLVSTDKRRYWSACGHNE